MTNTESNCESEWKKIINSAFDSSLPEEYSKMLLYSGITVNNLGNFDSCNNLESAKYILFLYNRTPLAVQAFCGPKTCDIEDYYNFPLAISKPSNIIPVKEYQQEHYGDYNSGAIIMMIFIVFIFMIGILSTYCDIYFEQAQKQNKIIEFLLCFSIKNNWKNLAASRDPENNDFSFLDGVRALSILWIILGHVANIYVGVAVLSNYDTALYLIKDFSYTFVISGFYAVDTFFWISGFLMAYFLLIKTKGNFSIKDLWRMYLHRYLRITPLYIFCLFFFWTLEEYIGSGPVWINIQETNQDCDKYWYTNLLYLNNFIPDWNGNNCFGVSWYLAIDMQLFIISPFIIFLYTRIQKITSWCFMFFICLISIVISGLIAMKYDLNPVAPSSNNGENYNFKYYTKPYTRLAPYFLGISCAFIIFSYKEHKENSVIYDKYALFIAKLQENKFIRLGSMIFGWILINIMIFSLYDTYQYPGKNYDFPHWSKASNYTFIALQRFIYGLGLSMIFLPLLLGHFKTISSFLSIYPWIILSKLTFAIYLIHVDIGLIALWSQENVVIFNWYNNIRDTIYFFILSIIFAIPIILLIEMPIINLEKIIFKRQISELQQVMISQELKEFKHEKTYI